MNPSITKYAPSLKIIILFFAILAGISCQKEQSLEHGVPGGGVIGGSATFTLVPTGGNCSDAVVIGNYEVGAQLNVDAQITVTVNVTKTGDWTYTTAQVNGFFFAVFGDLQFHPMADGIVMVFPDHNNVLFHQVVDHFFIGNFFAIGVV